MKLTTKAAALTAVLALVASPALALPPQVPSNSGTQHAPNGAGNNDTNTPGPHASLPAKAKAYGKYCQSFSKKHVAGTPGTPFSKCVTDMAKLASSSSTSPRKACRDQSKKHVEGEKGTAFSRCVAAGAKLLRDEDDASS
jgi:hypothetical protein